MKNYFIYVLLIVLVVGNHHKRDQLLHLKLTKNATEHNPNLTSNNKTEFDDKAIARSHFHEGLENFTSLEESRGTSLFEKQKQMTDLDLIGFKRLCDKFTFENLDIYNFTLLCRKLADFEVSRIPNKIKVEDTAVIFENKRKGNNKTHLDEESYSIDSEYEKSSEYSEVTQGGNFTENLDKMEDKKENLKSNAISDKLVKKKTKYKTDKEKEQQTFSVKSDSSIQKSNEFQSEDLAKKEREDLPSGTINETEVIQNNVNHIITNSNNTLFDKKGNANLAKTKIFNSNSNKDHNTKKSKTTKVVNNHKNQMSVIARAFKNGTSHSLENGKYIQNITKLENDQPHSTDNGNNFSILKNSKTNKNIIYIPIKNHPSSSNKSKAVGKQMRNKTKHYSHYKNEGKFPNKSITNKTIERTKISHPLAKAKLTLTEKAKNKALKIINKPKINRSNLLSKNNTFKILKNNDKNESYKKKSLYSEKNETNIYEKEKLKTPLKMKSSNLNSIKNIPKNKHFPKQINEPNFLGKKNNISEPHKNKIIYQVNKNQGPEIDSKSIFKLPSSIKSGNEKFIKQNDEKKLTQMGREEGEILRSNKQKEKVNSEAINATKPIHDHHHHKTAPKVSYSTVLIVVCSTLIISTILLTVIGVYYRKVNLESRRYYGHVLLNTEEDMALFTQSSYSDNVDRYESWKSQMKL